MKTISLLAIAAVLLLAGCSTTEQSTKPSDVATASAPPQSTSESSSTPAETYACYIWGTFQTGVARVFTLGEEYQSELAVDEGSYATYQARTKFVGEIQLLSVAYLDNFDAQNNSREDHAVLSQKIRAEATAITDQFVSETAYPNVDLTLLRTAVEELDAACGL